MRSLIQGNAFIENSNSILILDAEILSKLSKAQKWLGGDFKQSVIPGISATISASDVSTTESLLEEIAGPIETPETWKARSAAETAKVNLNVIKSLM